MELKREIIQPTDKTHWLALRSQDVTSTEVSALFGISKYATELEVWHRHKQNLADNFEENERTKWGNRLQDAIALGVLEDSGFKGRAMTEYIRLPDLRIGSSFDWMIDGNDAGEVPSLLEIKNVDSLIFRDGWLVDGEHVEAPPHIEMQVQHQLLVSGLKRAYLAALIGGNRVILIMRERDETVISAIQSKVAKFWESVDKNEAPQPDFHRDAEVIKRLYAYAEPNKVIIADDDIERLVKSYKVVSDGAKALDDECSALKAELLTKIGDAEKCKGSSFSISAGLVGESEISYTRKGYRSFRINFKKEGSKK